jgi:hypothetical protein
MKGKISRFIALVGIGLGLMIRIDVALADSGRAPLKQLSAEWWQWALSIPTPENPLLDPNGEKCAVGQHGSVWFLGGNFGGGTATRTCSVPEDKLLFFPVINSLNIDTPNVCGQGSERIPVEELRALSAAFIDGATELSVEVDGKEKNPRRIQSRVFAVAVPEDNLFDAPCADAGLGNVPAGIYSPAVDDGVYVRLNRLKVGSHTVHFRAENPNQGFVLDITYNLTVVPVSVR